MEAAVLIGLLGIGYVLDKNKKDTHKVYDNIKPPQNQPSQNTIYDQSNISDAKKSELQIVNDRIDEANKGSSTMIDSLNMEGRNTLRKDEMSTLSGSPINKETFLTNNQGIKVEPFFSGAPPNINYKENRSLSNHQGGNPYDGSKREQSSFFSPQRNIGNVFGRQFTGPDSDKSRYIGGSYRSNELPFEQEKIQPIHSRDNLNRDIAYAYAQKSNTDNIRTLNNQKVSFGTKILPGKGMDKRGYQGQVFKNLPDKDYEQTPDQWLVTTGAIDSASIRPEQIVPDTNRQYFNKGVKGSAAPVVHQGVQDRPNMKKTTKQQLYTDNVRNASAEGTSKTDDHGVISYTVYPNEREVTEERTYEGNLKSVFSADTARLQDPVKQTMKQTTINSANNGYIASVTEVPTERLQDNVRPTVKSTTMFSHSGNASSYLSNETAKDQYLRADLNPNKEIISQGRYPTPESTKLASGGDRVNICIDKLEHDYFNHHQPGLDRIYQAPPHDKVKGEITRDKDSLEDRKISSRIEGNLLDPFKKNPYTHSLSSFAY